MVEDDGLLEALLKSAFEDSSHERHIRANASLGMLGQVQCNGEYFLLKMCPVIGDGFCLYRCLALQANMLNIVLKHHQFKTSILFPIVHQRFVPKYQPNTCSFITTEVHLPFGEEEGDAN